MSIWDSAAEQARKDDARNRLEHDNRRTESARRNEVFDSLQRLIDDYVARTNDPAPAILKGQGRFGQCTLTVTSRENWKLVREAYDEGHYDPFVLIDVANWKLDEYHHPIFEADEANEVIPITLYRDLQKRGLI